MDYVKIMDYLHNSPIGTRVMCDTATLNKLLTQYLITDDFHLVVNDLDNTPEATDENETLCNRRKTVRQFIPPEQRWPNISASLKMDNMPPHDEKLDIWKVPVVVERLLGDVNGSNFVKNTLEQVME